MSKVSGRPGREEIKRIRREKKKAEKALRAQQKAQGLKLPSKTAIPNRTCRYKTVEEEKRARQDATTEQVRLFRAKLPVLLTRLSRIKKPQEDKTPAYPAYDLRHPELCPSNGLKTGGQQGDDPSHVYGESETTIS